LRAGAPTWRPAVTPTSVCCQASTCSSFGARRRSLGVVVLETRWRTASAPVNDRAVRADGGALGVAVFDVAATAAAMLPASDGVRASTSIRWAAWHGTARSWSGNPCRLFRLSLRPPPPLRHRLRPAPYKQPVRGTPCLCPSRLCGGDPMETAYTSRIACRQRRVNVRLPTGHRGQRAVFSFVAGCDGFPVVHPPPLGAPVRCAPGASLVADGVDRIRHGGHVASILTRRTAAVAPVINGTCIKVPIGDQFQAPEDTAATVDGVAAWAAPRPPVLSSRWRANGRPGRPSHHRGTGSGWVVVIVAAGEEGASAWGGAPGSGCIIITVASRGENDGCWAQHSRQVENKQNQPRWYISLLVSRVPPSFRPASRLKRL